MEVGKLYRVDTERVRLRRPQLCLHPRSDVTLGRLLFSRLNSNEVFLVLSIDPEADGVPAGRWGYWVNILLRDKAYWIWFEPEVMIATLIGIE
jgi:hypothetical protein